MPKQLAAASKYEMISHINFRGGGNNAHYRTNHITFSSRHDLGHRAQGQACTPGEEACPVVLRMAPGSRLIEAAGFVSGEHPDFYFKFDARGGQKLIIHTEGGGLKTGPGIPITAPNGTQDAVDEDTPFTLPASGDYVIQMHAKHL